MRGRRSTRHRAAIVTRHRAAIVVALLAQKRRRCVELEGREVAERRPGSTVQPHRERHRPITIVRKRCWREQVVVEAVAAEVLSKGPFAARTQHWVRRTLISADRFVPQPDGA